MQAAARWFGNQDVRLLAHRLQLQAGILQQAHEALLHPIVTGKSRTAATADQRRIDRQVDPGQAGEPGERIAQAAGRHLITATSGVFGPGMGDEDRAGTQAQQQAQAQQRAQTGRRRAWTARLYGGH
ncbi:hypothetical protein D3C84_890770 [compost metagenome]